mgnify:CR=1 FL=1
MGSVVKSYEPLVSEEGASKIAEDALVKIVANGNVNFSKFKVPKLSLTDMLDRSPAKYI